MTQPLTGASHPDRLGGPEPSEFASAEDAGAVMSVPSGSGSQDGVGRSPETVATAGQEALDYIARSLLPLAVAIETLTEAPDNARRHSLDRDIPVLMESLRRFGQRKPVVAKRAYRGLSNVVIAGNGTVTAARRLGRSHIAVAWFEGSDDDAREYAISDNRTAELSAWDAGQLAALQADGVDLLSLWHDDADLGALLADAPVPDFEPVEAAHRLDQLASVVCPHCGGEIRREDLR